MADDPDREPDDTRRATRLSWFDSAEGGLMSNSLVVLLVFLLGVAMAFPAATLGLNFLVDNAVPVLSGMMAAFVVLLAFAAIVIAFRHAVPGCPSGRLRGWRPGRGGGDRALTFPPVPERYGKG